jgi:pyruvate/2-oxoglutarate/acetoin dehydrogenase E1 component
VPEGDEVVPLGVASIRRPGDDITLVTCGAMVTPSLEAADRMAREGIEVTDPDTHVPFSQVLEAP